MDKIQSAIKNVLKNCIKVRKDEKVLIITDKKKKKIAEGFFEYSKKITNNVILEIIPLGKVNGEEPPKRTAELMKKQDVILGITTKSLSHTKARKGASEKGVRIVTMPNINEGMIKRTLNADYNKVKEVNDRIISKIKNAKKIRVVTSKGTDIRIYPYKKRWFNDSGIFPKKRNFGNLPAGEVICMPAEGKTEGVFVVDGSIGGLGIVDQDVKITVKRGFAVKIEGGNTAKKFSKQLKDKNYRNIAEFAFGTNDKAKITGVTLEDEKALGTVHIALGNNKSYGGTFGVGFHSDCLIKEPDVYVDNKIVMKKGKFVI